MKRLSKCVSTVIQLWEPINLRTPEDVDNTFSETSVLNSATRYQVPESVLNNIIIYFYSFIGLESNQVHCYCGHLLAI
jgi:hypothetical protein